MTTARTSSPVTTPIRGDSPRVVARSRRASAQPCGSSPPALLTTRIPWSRHVPRTCSIWVRNVRAYPEPGPCFIRWRARISMVSSASQSPVRTSISPDSTSSAAADIRSPRNPEQLPIRTGPRACASTIWAVWPSPWAVPPGGSRSAGTVRLPGAPGARRARAPPRRARGIPAAPRRARAARRIAPIRPRRTPRSRRPRSWSRRATPAEPAPPCARAQPGTRRLGQLLPDRGQERRPATPGIDDQAAADGDACQQVGVARRTGTAAWARARRCR